MTTKPTRTYGFLIEEEKFADCPSVVARVMAREPKGHSEGALGPYPVNPRGEGEDTLWDAPKHAHGLMLDGLRIRCWANLDPKLGYFHGPDVNINDVAFIDLRKAKRILATMTRVENAVRKSEAREAGDVLMAVGKAIGATWYVHKVGKASGPFLSNYEWRFEPLTNAREEYRRLVTKIKALIPERQD